MICRTHYLEYHENKNYEQFISTGETNEALQNIASIYNNQNLTVNSANINDLTSGKSNSAKILFSDKWQGYPDNATDQAEICNDTTQYKSLMIAGNKAYGGVKEARNISLWDNVSVGNNLAVWHDLSVTNNSTFGGKTKFRKMDGIRASGIDLAIPRAISYEDCANKCADVKGALCAEYVNTGLCTCKNAIAVQGVDDAYTTGFMI